MKDILLLARKRRSVRTFDGRPLAVQELDALRAFAETADNPYGLKVQFRFLNAKERKLSCPVAVGTDLFLGAKIEKAPDLNEAYGYSFEKLVLYAQSLGIGTVWIGGTMDRKAFEAAMEMTDGEVMPCVSPIGYPASRMSLRETMMRKGVRADERMPFEKLFFDGSFASPLTEDRAGKLRDPLEAVRLAPSAVNRQPWRVVVTEKAAHFYLKRSSKMPAGVIDMQAVDMGIAMCHFDLTAREAGLPLRFAKNDPGIECPNGEEYIASFEPEEV